MHAIERELIKVTGYKARAKFDNRQDYLSSILNAVGKLTDDDFDNLSDDAAAWANAAVEAKNSRNEELPDFDETSPEDEEAEDDSTSDEADTEAEEDDEGDGADNAVSDDPDTVADSASDDDPDEIVDEDDEGTEDDEPEEVVKVKRGRKKKLSKEERLAKEARVAERLGKTKKLHNRNPRAHEDEDVILDKWGCMEGSKNHQALAMFEKGATTKEVKDKIGGTYYNILGKMVQNGHKMDKEGTLIKLTHKDELGKKAAPKATPKAVPAKKGKK